jgi:hypothetical protein
MRVLTHNWTLVVLCLAHWCLTSVTCRACVSSVLATKSPRDAIPESLEPKQRRICLAPKAQHSASAWGSSPGFVEPQNNVSAEGAIHFCLGFEKLPAELTRAFSAWLPGRSDSWGDAPGYYETAPLALIK